ncbi:MAG TPA: Asp-tRNA(Asn)/Glu-tRNA(Gln) amidotransferase subunit GatC [Candidatus Baltobacteraceae bacterium]|nr:Asp-tRNA(Asn)/Glu-tRNA(Gln) amidotransferase subunit GatC [Candidatus Baltobacteraceae bacterium]
MSLSREEILKISELAHIKLADDEIEKFRDQMSSVLEYVGQLADVDVKGVEPAAHISGVSNVLRDDVVMPTDPETRKALLDEAPEREGDLIKVKAVFK